MAACRRCVQPAVVAGLCSAHLDTRKWHACDSCGNPRGVYTAVYGDELHFCRGCWSADARALLDTLNIPTGDNQ